MNRWDKQQLGELVNILSGFAFDSEQFGDSGEMPIVRIRDVVPGHSSTFYRGEYDPKYVLRDGDVLIGMDGEFISKGRYVVSASSENSSEFTLSQAAEASKSPMDLFVSWKRRSWNTKRLEPSILLL